MAKTEKGHGNRVNDLKMYESTYKAKFFFIVSVSSLINTNKPTETVKMLMPLYQSEQFLFIIIGFLSYFASKKGKKIIILWT